MADKTVTVKESGGDHSTLNAALAFEVGDTPDLVTNTRILTISIEDAWTGVDATNITSLSGFTTSASYYIRIVTVGTARHDGTNFGSSQYSLEPTGSSHCIVCDQEYTRFEGLPIRLKDNPSNSSEGIRMDASSHMTVVDKCILWHEASDPDADGIYCWNSNSHTNGHQIYVYNTIIHGFTRGGINYQMYVNNSDDANIDIFNCTMYDNGSSGDGEGAGIHMRSDSNPDGTLTCDVSNTMSIDSVTSPSQQDFHETGSGTESIVWTGDYNANTTASDQMPGGNSFYASAGTADSDQGAGAYVIFTDITTNVDLHLRDLVAANNGVVDAGLAASQPPSPYAEDIDGDTREDPPEIGADEIVEAPPAVTFIPRMTMF